LEFSKPRVKLCRSVGDLALGRVAVKQKLGGEKDEI
jgi:hypothetical protein